MTQQGWSRGQALGARSSTPTNSSGTSTPNTSTSTSAAASATDAARLAAARVGVLFKDDTLGLGASLKSKDPNAKTGLDAFQGLLGRLNAKDKAEEEAVERKLAERRLEGYARGKWGMTFVPGGVLVQGDEFKNKREAAKAGENGEEVEETKSTEQEHEVESAVVEGNEISEKRKRKDGKKKRKLLESGETKNLQAAEAVKNPVDDESEKRRRKEERRKRKEAKTAAKALRTQAEHNADERKTAVLSSKSTSKSKPKTQKSSKSITTTPDEAPSLPATRPPFSSSSSSASNKSQTQIQSPTASPSLSAKTNTSAPTTTTTTNSKLPAPLAPGRSGRQILRSRNIAAKRKAFVDERALDGIFMRASTSTPASA